MYFGCLSSCLILKSVLFTWYCPSSWTMFWGGDQGWFLDVPLWQHLQPACPCLYSSHTTVASSAAPLCPWNDCEGYSTMALKLWYWLLLIYENKKIQIICVPQPADWDNHRVVFDIFKLASVLQSLQHCLPGIETLHTLRKKKKHTKKMSLIKALPRANYAESWH